MIINIENVKKEAEYIVEQMYIVKMIIICNSDDKERIIKVLKRRVVYINKSDIPINKEWIRNKLWDTITKIDECEDLNDVIDDINMDIWYWNTIKELK